MEKRYIAKPDAKVMTRSDTDEFHRAISCALGAGTFTTERKAVRSGFDPCPDCVLTDIEEDSPTSLADKLSGTDR